jgi:hypothetical protein
MTARFIDTGTQLGDAAGTAHPESAVSISF